MINKIWLWLLGLGLVLSLGVGKSWAYDVPNYEGFVNDYAQVLSADFESKLETELTELATASSGAELAVVTLNNLQGETIENVAQEFFDQWQIGKEDLDNGVLLIAAIEDRKLRIQLGYGAEPVITDAEAGRIIRQRIRPAFKNGDYEAGVRAGVEAILEQFESSPGFTPTVNPLNKAQDLKDKLSFTLAVMIAVVVGTSFFVYFAAWLGRTKAWWPGGVVGLSLGIFLGLIPGIFFGLFGLFLDYILSKNYKKWKREKKTTGWRKTIGGFHHSSGSSGSSFGGSSSSFGGGSSGGGGASGGW